MKEMDSNRWLRTGGAINLNLIRITNQGNERIFSDGIADNDFECSMRSAYCVIDDEAEQLARKDVFKDLTEKLKTKRMMFETINEYEFNRPSARACSTHFQWPPNRDDGSSSSRWQRQGSWWY